MALGCPDTEILIHPRGDVTRAVLSVPYSELSWDRRLDEVSQCNVTLDPTAIACCENMAALALVRPYVHEIGVWRGGELCWIGPLTVRKINGTGLILDALDLAHWFARRLNHTDFPTANRDLVQWWGQLAADALAPDPSPNITLTLQPGGVPIFGDRGALANSHRICADILAELSTTAVDWTTVLREVRYRRAELTGPPIAVLATDHWAETPTVTLDGQDLTTAWTVTGLGGGFEGDDLATTGTATAPFALTGLLESVEDENDIQDLVTATAAARTRLDRSDPNTPANQLGYITGGTLTQSAPLDLEPGGARPAIPGTIVTVATQVGCVNVTGDYRLTGVNVTVSRDLGERVSVSLQPVGTTA